MRPAFFLIASLCFTLASCTHKAPRADAPLVAIKGLDTAASSPSANLLTDDAPGPASASSVYVPVIANGPPPPESLAQVLIKIVLFLFLLSGGAYMFVRYLKGSSLKILGLGLSKNKLNKLQVKETRMLGHKQFLLVVEYEGQKMLLGTSPQGMQYLCKLDSQEVKSSEII